MSFRYLRIALVALVPACQATGSDAVQPVPPGRDPLLLALQASFPVPMDALIVPSTTDSAGNLGDLVERFTVVTGIILSINDDTRVALAQHPLGLDTPIVVPPEEVYSFVEGLLVDGGFLLRNLHMGQAPLFSLSHVSTVDENAGRSVVILWADSASILARAHPALHLTSSVLTGKTNARQMAASYRVAITHPDTQRIIAPDEGTVLITGTGRFVDGITRVIQGRVVDAEHERAAHEKKTTPPPDF